MRRNFGAQAENGFWRIFSLKTRVLTRKFSFFFGGGVAQRLPDPRPPALQGLRGQLLRHWSLFKRIPNNELHILQPLLLVSREDQHQLQPASSSSR